MLVDKYRHFVSLIFDRVSGIGFGGNYNSFPKQFEQAILSNPGGRPDFMLYDELGGKSRYGDYMKLTNDYDTIKRWYWSDKEDNKGYFSFDSLKVME